MQGEQMVREDERINALREVASDDCEYSGWVKLAQGALDVIAERDAEVERLREALRAITRVLDGPGYAGHLDAIEQIVAEASVTR